MTMVGRDVLRPVGQGWIVVWLWSYWAEGVWSERGPRSVSVWFSVAA
jgi:hypothetical protein